jgi:hypothetical protein
MNPFQYKKLPGYKYKLTEDFITQTRIRPTLAIIEPPEGAPYITLAPDGLMTIHNGYCWDGPSGPTIDTKDSIRGSCFHDAGYQLMRQKRIPISWRKYVDKMLRVICIQDGMSRARAWAWYCAVRLFAKHAATEHRNRDDETRTTE